MLRLGLLLLSALVLLTACRPLYLPLVPDSPPYEPGARLVSVQAELDVAGRPRLELSVVDVAAPAWLAVQWLAPSGREQASESVWVEPEGASAIVLSLPADVALVRGEWRAVVSLGGRLLRQFTFTVP